jgi:serine/threonine-protein kinase
MIPGIRDVFEENGQFYVVMDYVDGVTLEDYLKRNGPVSGKTAKKWAIDLCRVLYYLHTRKPPVIYRDLKPSNIMLCSDGGIRLIDFGIAREYRIGKKADTAILGTGGYAAPEQHGGGQSDPRSDIYSLGVTLRELLTGTAPAADGRKTEEEALRKEGSPVPEELEKVINKAMSEDPEERYCDCRKMAEDLFACELREGSAGRRRRRRKTGRILAGAAAVLFLAGGIAGFVSVRKDRAGRCESTSASREVSGTEETSEAEKGTAKADADRPGSCRKLLRDLESGTFADREHAVFDSFWRKNRERYSREPFYPEMLLEAGKLYFYHYKGEDESLRVRILRAGPYFAEAQDCAEAPASVRSEAKTYGMICSFCSRYLFDAASRREPDRKEYVQLLKSMEACVRETEERSGEAAAFSEITILTGLSDILNNLRFGMARRGIPKSRILGLYRNFSGRARFVKETDRQTVEAGEELLKNLSDYEENLDRAYENAAEKQQEE